MPSQICNDQGTALISPAGGIVDLKYHDFRDFLGQSNIFTLSKNPIKEKLSVPSSVKINSKSFTLPTTGKTTDVLISGKAQNYKLGTKIKLTLSLPNGKSSVSYVYATRIGDYKCIISLKPNSLVGQYNVNIDYQQFNIGKVTFMVNKK